MGWQDKNSLKVFPFFESSANPTARASRVKQITRYHDNDCNFAAIFN
jgi:hypothetical protein